VSTTRERILSSSTELFGRQGYSGTGMNQIVAEAEAALGSIYHFFPGGKDELCEESIRTSGQIYLTLIKAVLDGTPDIVEGVTEFFRGAGAQVGATDYADACPIATIALEVASTNDLLRRATADVFDSWVAAASDRLERAGIECSRARELAVFALSALEGAFILSRAHRDTTPILIAGNYVSSAIREALPPQAVVPRKSSTRTEGERR
jgi:AcrR family transcriptional regulator